MTFYQFLSILRARWKAAAAVFLLIVGGVVALTLLVEEKYSASASVVVDVRPDPLSAMGYGVSASAMQMATQVDIIRSDRVSLRVIRGLRLTENPEIQASWRAKNKGSGDIETWLIGLFRKELEVEPARESTVIRIAYEAGNPQFAAVVANAFAQAYIDTMIELRVDPAKQYSAFFDARAKEARDKLEEAQSRLSKFQRENGLVMTDERLDIENQRLNELSSQLVVVGAMTAEASSRFAQATAGSADKLQEISSNPLVSGLRADLSRQEARVQEIGARLGDSHPQVVELNANVAAMRQRLDTEIKRLSAGVGVSSTISRSREAQIRGELEAQRAKVLKLKQVRDEGALIQRDVESAQRNFEMVSQRLTQSTLESQANSANASLLSPASPPIVPSSPKVILNISIAVLLGALLAIGVCLLLEMLDRRVRTLDDVVLALDLPVLGVLPGLTNSRNKNKTRALAHQHLLKRLPASPGLSP